MAGLLQRYEKRCVAHEKMHEKNQLLHTYATRLKTMLDFEEDAIAGIREGRLVMANQAFFKMTGVDNVSEYEKRYPNVLGFIEKSDFLPDLIEKGEHRSWMRRLYDEKR